MPLSPLVLFMAAFSWLELTVLTFPCLLKPFPSPTVNLRMKCKSLYFIKLFQWMCVNNTCDGSATIIAFFGANRNSNTHKKFALEEGPFCIDCPLGKDWKTDKTTQGSEGTSWSPCVVSVIVGNYII